LPAAARFTAVLLVSGQSPHTAKYRPWNLIAAVQFTDDEKAAAFKRYLKTGSGFAFANRHFY
jgi:hypothetical protein